MVVVAAWRNGKSGRRLLVAGEQGDQVIGAVLGVLGEDVDDEPGGSRARRCAPSASATGPAAPCRRSRRRPHSRSGKATGSGPPARPGRSNMSPASFGPSWILYSAASALTCASENSGPPGSARLRKATYLQAVAVRAYLPVDLESALELAAVELSERPLEAPVQGRGHRRPLVGEGGCRKAENQARRRWMAGFIMSAPSLISPWSPARHWRRPECRHRPCR